MERHKSTLWEATETTHHHRQLLVVCPAVAQASRDGNLPCGDSSHEQTRIVLGDPVPKRES